MSFSRREKVQPSVVGKTAETLYFSCYVLPGAFRLPPGLADARARAVAALGASKGKRERVTWATPADVWFESPDGNHRRRPGVLGFEVKGGGSASGYHFVLRNDDLSIEAQERGMTETPAVYVQLRARLVWAVGYEAAVRWALALVGKLFGRVNESLLSRVDFTVDVQGWKFHRDDVERFVTRSKKWAQYMDTRPAEVGAVYFKPKFTGVEFSRGSPLSCRIYDKMAEIKANKTKTWFYDVWRAGGWDGESRVWRVEFQVRREVLREFGLTHGAIRDLSAFDALFQYLTVDWLRFVEKRDRVNVGRSVTDPVWTLIQAAQFGERSAARAVRRRAQKLPEMETLLPMLRGVLTTVAARHGALGENRLAQFVMLTIDKMQEERGLDGEIREKMAKFALMDVAQVDPQAARLRKLIDLFGVDAAMMQVYGEEFTPTD